MGPTLARRRLLARTMRARNRALVSLEQSQRLCAATALARAWPQQVAQRVLRGRSLAGPALAMRLAHSHGETEQTRLGKQAAGFAPLSRCASCATPKIAPAVMNLHCGILAVTSMLCFGAQAVVSGGAGLLEEVWDVAAQGAPVCMAASFAT